MARRKRKPPAVQAHNDGPTPEQLARGGISREFVTHAETATVSMAHVAAHSPVERWRRNGALTDAQLAAIATVRALWELVGLRQKTTATYGEPIRITHDNEWLAARKIQAMRDLTRLEAQCPPWAWDVFENCVRFDEPAGIAGSALGFEPRSAVAAALVTVKMVADIVAREECLS